MSGARRDSPAIGFPIVLAGLVVASVVFARVWRAVAKKADQHR